MSAVGTFASKYAYKTNEGGERFISAGAMQVSLDRLTTLAEGGAPLHGTIRQGAYRAASCEIPGYRLAERRYEVAAMSGRRL